MVMIIVMIPRKIHYCWYGDQPPSDLIKKCMESWQIAMPDYQIKRWDVSNSPLDHSYAREAYVRRQWSALSNYIRLHALRTEGGIYLDTDIETLKSLTPLLDDHCFLGFQQELKQQDWVNTAVLGAEPGHSFLAACMHRLEGSFRNTGRFERSPLLTTAILRKSGLNRYGLQTVNDVTIYPVEYFYPFSWLEKYSPDRITTQTYCVHYWTATWKTSRSLEWPVPIKRFKRAVLTWVQRQADKSSR